MIGHIHCFTCSAKTPYTHIFANDSKVSFQPFSIYSSAANNEHTETGWTMCEKGHFQRYKFISQIPLNVQWHTYQGMMGINAGIGQLGTSSGAALAAQNQQGQLMQHQLSQSSQLQVQQLHTQQNGMLGPIPTNIFGWPWSN